MTEREWTRLFYEAEAAGRAAADAARPPQYQAVQRANPLDDTSPVVKRWAQPFELCGFAEVVFRPGNGKPANAAKRRYGYRGGNGPYAGYGMGRRDWHEAVGLGEVGPRYYGGVSVSVWYAGQSYERKVAYATAYAKVLTDAGVEGVYTDGRLD